MFKPKKVIIHCTDSTWGSVAEITKWHKARGFKTIGYHYVILNGKKLNNKFNPMDDGIVQGGRSLAEKGAHSKGQNHDSIGIALVGVDEFTVNQLFALRHLLSGLMETYNIPLNKIYPHSRFNSKKTCPNFNVYDFLAENLQKLITEEEAMKAIDTLAKWKAQKG